MTELSDIKYPLRLCVEMLYYSVLLNKKTQSMTIPEIRKALKVGIKIPCAIDDIKAGSTSGSKVALEPFELKKIKDYYDSEFINNHRKLILGYFLFSCVTGLRYSDVMNIDRDAVQGNFIQFKSIKVDKVQTISFFS